MIPLFLWKIALVVAGYLPVLAYYLKYPLIWKVLRRTLRLYLPKRIENRGNSPSQLTGFGIRVRFICFTKIPMVHYRACMVLREGAAWSIGLTLVASSVIQSEVQIRIRHSPAGIKILAAEPRFSSFVPTYAYRWMDIVLLPHSRLSIWHSQLETGEWIVEVSSRHSFDIWWYVRPRDWLFNNVCPALFRWN